MAERFHVDLLLISDTEDRESVGWLSTLFMWY